MATEESQHEWARPEFLVCRDYGHAWNHKTAFMELKRGIVYRTVTCLHGCGTKRVEEIAYESGTRIRAPNYERHKGYLLPGNSGENRLTKDDFRRLYLQQTLKPNVVIDLDAVTRRLNRTGRKKRSSAKRRRLMQ